MHFRNGKHSITSVDLRIGDSPKLALNAGGEGVSLPSAQLPLPVRAQVQIEGGACFEGTYDGDGLRKNANGIFKALSVPSP